MRLSNRYGFLFNALNFSKCIKLHLQISMTDDCLRPRAWFSVIPDSFPTRFRLDVSLIPTSQAPTSGKAPSRHPILPERQPTSRLRMLAFLRRSSWQVAFYQRSITVLQNTKGAGPFLGGGAARSSVPKHIQQLGRQQRRPKTTNQKTTNDTISRCIFFFTCSLPFCGPYPLFVWQLRLPPGWWQDWRAGYRCRCWRNGEAGSKDRAFDQGFGLLLHGSCQGAVEGLMGFLPRYC